MRLELDGRPVAIFGANGAGKTNILEAISLLSPGRGLRRAQADVLMRKPELLGWKVSATVESLEQVHEIDITYHPQEGRQLKIDGKSAPQAALGRLARVLWLVPSMDRLWLEGAEGRRRFLDRMALSFEPSHGEAVLQYEKSMRDRNRLLKDNVSDDSWYRALEGRMAEAGAKVFAHRRAALTLIEAAQRDAATSFPVASLALMHWDGGAIGPEDEDSLRSAFHDNRRQDMFAGRTLIGPHRSDLLASYADKDMAAKECSTGEQKALLVSLILANARALQAQVGMAPILLLDEVAAHLDPDRRKALYDEIDALGAQAFMTGTEAGLFEAIQSRAMSIEVFGDVGGAEAKTVI